MNALKSAQRSTLSLTIIFCVVFVLASANAQGVSSFIIVNATIVDGTGSPPRVGAVRIKGDRIEAVGDLTPQEGESVVDAAHLVLTPGFIDSHSHHDIGMFDQPTMTAAASQGITTIVRGADGGAVLATSGNYAGLAAFHAQLGRQPVALNVATFAPHGAIRTAVMGSDFKRVASPEEVDAMSELVADDMKSGALGLSTGLEYEPGIHSATEEVIALAKVASSFGGRYASHIRDEDDRFLEALEELLTIGHEARIPVHLSHVKLADLQAWGQTGQVIARLNDAREKGIEVSADIYPYLHWQSVLAVLFPNRDYTNIEAARFTFERTTTPQDLLITSFPARSAWVGLTVAQIALQLELSPEETLLRLAQMSDELTRRTGMRGDSIVAKSMNEGDVRAFMGWQHTNICSDGGLDGGHPRGAGAFPRVLSRYVGPDKMTLAQAVHKMTSLTAKNMGISDRGELVPGAFADLVLFDPNEVKDNATFTEPKLLSSGIKTVWVNGQVVFADGKPTGTLAGTIVRR